MQTIQKRRILLVDDDLLILTLLKQVLQQAGYDTIEASSGEESIKVISDLDNEPDLALLDVHMRRMSGLDVAKHLQARSTIPFMFISSDADKDVVRQATDYGAVGYLVKPIEVRNIVPAFEAALARADEIKKLKRSEINLTLALNAGRETSMAVGLLMERYKTDRDTAFEALRDHARAQRRKINEVAKELLEAAEALNAFKMPPAEQARSK